MNIGDGKRYCEFLGQFTEWPPIMLLEKSRVNDYGMARRQERASENE